ncbi:regulator of microtubule dynamics protein 3-like [Ctenocephalides felis]|uniref:regulator of microtubule dynamics protein 3-like n=1 Tax=Ctenocephalides felis TaxID=7515 RepID=UPI000E6E36A3|nr:regulator of microtubule dynamics protein 3-like [Ctenocephalides felis]
MSNTAPNYMFGIMGACVVGIVGAAGMFIYEKVLAEKKRRMLCKQVDSLDKRLESLQAELDALRKLQKETAQKEANKSKHRRKRIKPLDGSVKSTKSETDSPVLYNSDTDMYTSALSTDMDNSSDEFYDLSTDTEDEKTTSVVEALEIVDNTLKASHNSEADLKSVLVKLNETTKQSNENAELYWRLAKVCYRLSILATGQEREEWISKGLINAEKALELNEANSECHKWYAILMGSRVEFLGIKDKIEEGFVFKKHVERALELNPSDPYLYHLLGRFKYEVSGLTWIERKLASSLFAEPPTSTYPEAIEDFKKAEELSILPSRDNRFLLAKSYIAISDFENAAKWLKLAKSTQSDGSATSKVNDEELDRLLSKYSNLENSMD